jgi:hypothetical protein
MVNPNLPSPLLLYRIFSEAKPFKHICIDNFLDKDIAEGLLLEFPDFDKRNAINEAGRIGGKSTQENTRALGNYYTEIDDYISSEGFLTYLSQITGIPKLLYDKEYFGGGTHENLDGQNLDTHIDFNYHRSAKIHRRLNLIIYLNKEWEDSWGGQIEIHSNPREPETNQISAFSPLFNRCVIFETNEYSWHGFPKITLPEDKKHLSRKSFAVYFYTLDRPKEEIVPAHTTFYVQRPMSNSIKPNQILSEENYSELKSLIRARDHWITFYQNLELKLNKEIENLNQKLEAAKIFDPVPINGPVTQISNPNNFYPDKWTGDRFKVDLNLISPTSKIILTGSLPEFINYHYEIAIKLNGENLKNQTIKAGGFIIEVSKSLEANQNITIEIESSTFNPKSLGMNNDNRDLGFFLESLVFQ